ncbi:MAG: hypothetical protein EBX36_13660, partial [Planctomycetia bacterium]|nr:hypothetical protein [Planctomycetia bacterium]
PSVLSVITGESDWTFTPSSPLSDGPHNFTADQKDAAGNTSPTSNQVAATIDSTAPDAPAITPLQGPTNDDTPTIIGTAEPNSIVKIYEGTTLLGTVTADGSGNWSFTPTTPLSDGTHMLGATSTDAAGNVSPMSGKVAVVVDTTPPSATVVAPANGATDVSINDNLVVTFSEPVVLGTSGVIELRAADGTLIESFGVGSSRISLSGSTLTIDPTANLAYASGYYVTIASGMLQDLAGNPYAGMANATDWAFTTSALPVPPTPAGLDLQAASDTGRSNTDNITSDNTPTLDVALNPSGLNPGDIVHLYASGVEVGTATLTADDIAAGKVSITTSTLADGVHSLTAKVSDAN